MVLNAGIITDKLQETRAFYVEKLGFGITFESDWFLLLHTPGHKSEVAFMLPDMPGQAPIFRQKFAGSGIFLTIEMDEVDEWYAELQKRGVAIEVAMRDEEWGDRHFAVLDPNGIGIDFVRHTPQAGG